VECAPWKLPRLYGSAQYLDAATGLSRQPAPLAATAVAAMPSTNRHRALKHVPGDCMDAADAARSRAGPSPLQRGARCTQKGKQAGTGARAQGSPPAQYRRGPGIQCGSRGWSSKPPTAMANEIGQPQHEPYPSPVLLLIRPGLRIFWDAADSATRFLRLAVCACILCTALSMALSPHGLLSVCFTQIQVSLCTAPHWVGRTRVRTKCAELLQTCFTGRPPPAAAGG